MSIQEQILRAIDAAAERLIEVSREIHGHPELRFQEQFAVKTLTSALEAYGLAAQQPTGGLETAFRTKFDREPKPKIAILAEYDALPNGHACGHNLIAGAALRAAVGLAAVRDQLPGQVVLLGIPGEEPRVQRGYKDMRDNMTMARRFGEHLRAMGVEFQEKDPTAGSGSTDMGDVSYAVPSIHPYMAICDIGESMCHQDTFVECANRPRGYQTMLDAAKAMALTAADLLAQPALLAAAKAEWARGQS